MKYDICSFCGGIVVKEQAKVDYWWGDELVIIENVPARVCQQCGEKYFSAEVSKKMEEIARVRGKAKNIVKVPLIEYEETFVYK